MVILVFLKVSSIFAHMIVAAAALFCDAWVIGDPDSQVLSQRDMGMFQDVTTSTMERGISTLRGFTTLMSLSDIHTHTGNTVLSFTSSPCLDILEM